MTTKIVYPTECPICKSTNVMGTGSEAHTFDGYPIGVYANWCLDCTGDNAEIWYTELEYEEIES